MEHDVGTVWVNPPGLLCYGGLLFAGNRRFRNANGSAPDLIPSAYQFQANFIFGTEEHSLLGTSVAEWFSEPRVVSVSKCRWPHLLLDFMVDPEEDYPKRVKLAFEDVVMLRLASREVRWDRIKRLNA